MRTQIQLANKREALKNQLHINHLAALQKRSKQRKAKKEREFQATLIAARSRSAIARQARQADRKQPVPVPVPEVLERVAAAAAARAALLHMQTLIVAATAKIAYIPRADNAEWLTAVAERKDLKTRHLQLRAIWLKACAERKAAKPPKPPKPPKPLPPTIPHKIQSVSKCCGASTTLRLRRATPTPICCSCHYATTTEHKVTRAHLVPAHKRTPITLEQVSDFFYRGWDFQLASTPSQTLSIRDCAQGAILHMRYGKRLQKTSTIKVDLSLKQ